MVLCSVKQSISSIYCTPATVGSSCYLFFQTAFKSQMLKPDLNCIKSESHLVCMHMIQNGIADLMVLEAGDIYRAGM